MTKVVQVTSKHSFIHVIAREHSANVQFLDRRWWEFRPRMRVNIPYRDLSHMVKIHRNVMTAVIERGYSPGVQVKVISV